ncbi:MAG TPA: DUF1800 domain-containing protein [Blastocatellia bacterium]
MASTTAMTYDDAAHLLRRMGFGGTAAQINNLVPMGREGAVNYLMNYSAIDDSNLEQVLSESFDFSDPTNTQNFNATEIRRWWYTRMVLTQQQFLEKMVLFWHNHFATSLSKVPALYMYVQNQTLRQNVLAQFDTILLAIAQDPAMLIWLDGITNVAGTPNENFARELQELFTMGTNDVLTGQANYSQSDVEGIAAAFTGWKFQASATNPFSPQFVVNASQHDNGPKTIYGQTADFDGQDVITLIAARQSTANFMVTKLFEFFVYPLDTSNPNDIATIEQFANVYMSTNHSISALLQAIFTSEQFFSDQALFALIKTPPEVISGSIRLLGANYNPGGPTHRDSSLYIASANMGMDIFNPINVAGWELNLGWVNTGAMLERFNFADQFMTNRFTNPATPGASITNTALAAYVKPNAKKTLNNLLTALGPLTPANPAIKVLKHYMEAGDNGALETFTGDAASIDEKVRGVVHQIMCLPEFQLN